ncbi:MAG: S-methyl-5-thioribose-1-phosphate isomerase [Bdellovibrionota bacterium]
MSSLQAIRYNNSKLELLNQLLLPQQFEFEDCSSCELTFHAIRSMKVRGAPAIAIAAALALACELKQINFNSQKELQQFVFSKLNFLCESRPTAVNLFKMAEDIKNLFEKPTTDNANEFKNHIISFAEKIYSDDIQTNKLIGDFGAKFILQNKLHNLNVLTHCNTGSLATAGYGTALGVVRSLYAQNKLNHVYATETRPYNQGARLTAFELVYEKIPSTLITDSMVSFLMKTKKIDAVLVGADRVASNGDTANKIGTYQIAVAAAYHNIPFYVAAPTTSIDFKIKSGEEIHIEERPKQEVTHIQNIQIAASGIDVWNPSFDITPASLITGIITEHGVKTKNNHGEFQLNDSV